MVTETFCAEETFELGRSLGEQAKPGDIYTDRKSTRLNSSHAL